MRRELTTEHELFAENRAFALRDNFVILEDELKRLALLPEMTAGDADFLQEEQILAGAHENSVLYNTAVLLLSRDGVCVRSVPDRSEFRGKAFGDRAWFAAARGGAPGPSFRVTDEPGLGRTLKIVQPLIRGKRFAGALVGVIALAEDNLLTPALHENLPRDTDAVLVDETGQIDLPIRSRARRPGFGMGGRDRRRRARRQRDADRRGERAVGAVRVLARARGDPLRGRVLAAVADADREPRATGAGAGRHPAVRPDPGARSRACCWPATWRARCRRWRAGAIRIARGEPVPAAERPRARTEEVATLLGAFEDMEKSIRQRDQELRDAAALLEERVRERTRELLATQAALVDAERFAAMGKTSAAIAHELKNSLNGLGMAVELIAYEPTNEARVARLRPQVVGEIARLRDVVDSLLSFSRSPRIERARRPDRRDRARRRPAGRSGGRTRRGPDGERTAGVVDALRRAQGPGRGGQPAEERDRGRKTRRGHAAPVRSDGDHRGRRRRPGLSADAREHLFEPFFTTKPNGTGLGLPTSRRFIEAHGGRIEADTSAALGGALFRLRLPLEAADVAGEKAPEAPRA